MTGEGISDDGVGVVFLRWQGRGSQMAREGISDDRGGGSQMTGEGISDDKKKRGGPQTAGEGISDDRGVDLRRQGRGISDDRGGGSQMTGEGDPR